jgi:hypothetical protein
MPMALRRLLTLPSTPCTMTAIQLLRKRLGGHVYAKLLTMIVGIIPAGEPAYTTTCLHVRATITKWLDKDGDVA